MNKKDIQYRKNGTSKEQENENLRRTQNQRMDKILDSLGRKMMLKGGLKAF